MLLGSNLAADPPFSIFTGEYASLIVIILIIYGSYLNIQTVSL